METQQTTDPAANPNPPVPLSPTQSYNFVDSEDWFNVTVAFAQRVATQMAAKGYPGATIWALALSTSSSQAMPANPFIPQSQFAAYKVPSSALLFLQIPGVANYHEVAVLAYMLMYNYPPSILLN